MSAWYFCGYDSSLCWLWSEICLKSINLSHRAILISFMVSFRFVWKSLVCFHRIGHFCFLIFWVCFWKSSNYHSFLILEKTWLKQKTIVVVENYEWKSRVDCNCVSISVHTFIYMKFQNDLECIKVNTWIIRQDMLIRMILNHKY